MVEEFTESVSVSVTNTLTAAANFLPNLVAAIIIFIVGVIVAALLKEILARILEAITLEKVLARTGIAQTLKKADPSLTVSNLLGELLRWIVIIVALVPTVQALGLERVSDLLTLLLGYLPNVVLAVVVVLLGAVFAQFARDIVVGASSSLGSTVSRTLGQIARWAILIFAILAALSQLGVAEDLILTLFQGFVALVAIAGGLAFGLGGQEAAKDIIKKVREEVAEKK